MGRAAILLPDQVGFFHVGLEEPMRVVERISKRPASLPDMLALCQSAWCNSWHLYEYICYAFALHEVPSMA